jgi:hypothetical protein
MYARTGGRRTPDLPPLPPRPRRADDGRWARFVPEQRYDGKDAQALRWRRPCRRRSRRKHTTAPYLVRQMSMDFVSQEHGVPHDGPKDSNAGG